MTTSPFASASAYARKGWTGLLPLPTASKTPPPSGFTGHAGQWPSEAHVAAWGASRPDANIAVRLPDGVIGIDVDHYGTKTGGATIAELESRLGALPPTVRSTSREDGPSGIYLYTVPEGLAWPREAGAYVDVIQTSHRYLVAAPSVHPDGRVYRWVDRTDTDTDIPCRTGLPALPDAWVEALSRGVMAERVDLDVDDFLAGLKDGEPSPSVSAILKDFGDSLDSGDDRHRAMLRVTEALAVAGAGGALGVPSAMAMAQAAYLSAKGDDREVRADWDRGLAGTVRRIANGEVTVAADSSLLVLDVPQLVCAPPVRERSSWSPVDLTDFLDDNYEAPRATMMPRADGVMLIYPGLTHSFHGESESGKSMLLQFETVRLITAGRPVLFVDFESDPRSVVSRLRSFGASRTALGHLTYVRPEESFDAAAWDRLLARPYDLAVVDGVTDSLALLGWATKDNDDVTKWNRQVPRMIADRTGAGVAVIDHVTKSTGDRGRFAIGGQSKLSGLTGAAYTVEVEQALAPGRRGIIVVRIGKDRPGAVREHGGTFRKTDRTQAIARVVVDSTDKRHPPIVTWEVPLSQPENDPGAVAAHRDGVLREKVSRIIEEAGADGISKARVEKGAGANKDAVGDAIAWLIQKGHTREELGSHGARLQITVTPFRAEAPEHGGDDGGPF